MKLVISFRLSSLDYYIVLVLQKLVENFGVWSGPLVNLKSIIYCHHLPYNIPYSMGDIVR